MRPSLYDTLGSMVKIKKIYKFLATTPKREKRLNLLHFFFQYEPPPGNKMTRISSINHSNE